MARPVDVQLTLVEGDGRVELGTETRYIIRFSWWVIPLIPLGLVLLIVPWFFYLGAKKENANVMEVWALRETLGRMMQSLPQDQTNATTPLAPSVAEEPVYRFPIPLPEE